MKIVIVVHSLGGGGAERAAFLLAQGLVARNHQVNFITLFGRESDFYHLPENIPRIALKAEGNSINALAAIKNNLRRLLLMRQGSGFLSARCCSFFFRRNQCFDSNFLSGQ